MEIFRYTCRDGDRVGERYKVKYMDGRGGGGGGRRKKTYLQNDKLTPTV